MSLRDRIIGKQGIEMAHMDDELHGINGGHTWPTLENMYKAAGHQQEGFHWMYCICVALFCVLCSICVLCVFDVLGLI